MIARKIVDSVILPAKNAVKSAVSVTITQKIIAPYAPYLKISKYWNSNQIIILNYKVVCAKMKDSFYQQIYKIRIKSARNVMTTSVRYVILKIIKFALFVKGGII